MTAAMNRSENLRVVCIIIRPEFGNELCLTSAVYDKDDAASLQLDQRGAG